MRDLLLEIDPSLGRRVGLEQALRHAIRSGQLEPGAPVPSTRTLAADYQLSRATVVAAYEQLAIEGYLVSNQGSGTTVAPRPRTTAQPPRPEQPWPSFPVDFRPGEPDASTFPRTAWMQSLRRVLTAAPDDAFGYPDPRGHLELRRSLAAYLGRSRAVVAEPESVRMYGGAVSALSFLAEALRRHGVTAVAIEDPSLFVTRDALRLGGLRTVPVPVDEHGLDVAALDDQEVGAVLVTPAHQFPLGSTMSAGRRADLIRWATEGNRWVIEDDYDGEFRYDRQPVGSLQGLDPDRVVYVGTTSKSVGPGLRLAWMVVPAELEPVLGRVTHMRAGVSGVDQLALADFIDRGSLDRHLRKMRSLYQRRGAVIADRLGSGLPWLIVPSIRAGLHLTVTLTADAPSEAMLLAESAERSIGLMGLGMHWSESAVDPTEGLVLGYSRPAEHAFLQSIDTLSGFLRGL